MSQTIIKALWYVFRTDLSRETRRTAEMLTPVSELTDKILCLFIAKSICETVPLVQLLMPNMMKLKATNASAKPPPRKIHFLQYV